MSYYPCEMYIEGHECFYVIGGLRKPNDYDLIYIGTQSKHMVCFVQALLV